LLTKQSIITQGPRQELKKIFTDPWFSEYAEMKEWYFSVALYSLHIFKDTFYTIANFIIFNFHLKYKWITLRDIQYAGWKCI
jgi:hypothetical protein